MQQFADVGSFSLRQGNKYQPFFNFDLFSFTLLTKYVEYSFNLKPNTKRIAHKFVVMAGNVVESAQAKVREVA
jgi:hypothetical protein